MDLKFEFKEGRGSEAARPCLSTITVKWQQLHTAFKHGCGIWTRRMEFKSLTRALPGPGSSPEHTNDQAAHMRIQQHSLRLHRHAAARVHIPHLQQGRQREAALRDSLAGTSDSASLWPRGAHEAVQEGVSVLKERRQGRRAGRHLQAGTIREVNHQSARHQPVLDVGLVAVVEERR